MPAAQLLPRWSYRAAVLSGACSLPTVTKIVLVDLDTYRSERNPLPFPSQTTLATDTGLSERSVRKALRMAEDAGWTKRQPRWKPDGGRLSDAYELLVPDGIAAPGAAGGGRHEETLPPGTSGEGPPAPHAGEVVKGIVQGTGKASAPASGAAAGVSRATAQESPKADTWLTPYLELHTEILGGKPPAGVMAQTFKSLETLVAQRNPEAPAAKVQATILSHQRRYLQHLVDKGKPEYLSYPQFLATFGQWGRKPASGARPTASSGKDYQAGLTAMGRGSAT